MECWCVTSFFSADPTSARYEHFERFARRMIGAGVTLLTVELVFPDTKRFLPEVGNVIRLHANDVFWHKEALLNYGFSQLPSSCDIAMYADCDLLFPEEDWVSQIAALAECHDVIQCFRTVACLKDGDHQGTSPPQTTVHGVVSNWARGMRSSHPQGWGRITGAPGGAWAIMHPQLRRKPFYDRHVLGGGDRIFAESVLGLLEQSPLLERFSAKQRADVLSWSRTIPQHLRVTYAPIDLQHLWHGSASSRSYVHLWKVLRQFHYDPSVDLYKGHAVYQWTSRNPELKRRITAHFRGICEKD